MRSGITRADYQAPEGFSAFAYMRVTNFDGTWVNLGALAVGGQTLQFTTTSSWSDDIDRNTLSMTATFKREIGPFSLVPFRSDSPVNVDDTGTDYSPLLDLSREWEIMGCFLPIGTVPVDESDFRQMAAGICSRIDVQGDPATVTVQGNGYEADLIDRRILFVDNTADPPVSITTDTPKTYAGGTLATVLQAILDDELGVGAVPLTVDPSAPAFYVNGWDQTTDVGLFDLLTQVAGLAGANVRYRYDSSDVLSLTLFAVNRNATTPDWSIDGDEFEKRDVGIDRAGIRNYVVVVYVDDLYGIQTVTSPVDVPPTSASISRYRVRPLVISLAATTQVTDQTSAGNLADAIRSDLEFPVMEQQIQGTGLWFGDLGDYVQIVADGVLSNEDQFGGITGYTHTFANGELNSTINLRGKPSGGYRTWLTFGPGKPRTSFAPGITLLTATAYEGTVFAARVTGVAGTATVNQYTRSVTFDLSTTADLSVVLDTFSADVTAFRADAIFTGTTPDTIYYVRATPYSGPLSGGAPTGVAGPSVVASTFVNRLTPSQPQFDDLVDTIGDLAGTLGAIGIPIVFFEAAIDTAPLQLSTIPTAETEVGSEYRQQSYAVGAGSVRVGANIKAKTGTPTIGANYSLDGFSTTPSLVSFTPAGTGVRYSGWVAMAAPAQADIGVTWTVGAGADTATLDLYRVWLEYLPTIVAGGRVHTPAFAAAFV